MIAIRSVCARCFAAAWLVLGAGQRATLVANATVPAPLFEQIGDLHHPVTTGSAVAQRYFDQGLAFAFGFNHREAIRSFSAAAEVDPDCAMAHWGVALANGPHVNAPMMDDQVPVAWSALQRAQALAAGASPRERDYIEALSRRYVEKPVEDRSPLDRAYADAMRELVRKHPDDLNAAVLFAEALMDTMPWDYWTTAQEPKPEAREVMAALEHVMVRQPGHLGANHLYIHAVEAGPRPEAGLPSADRLLTAAPQLGHLVHMPAHIYVRVGQYAAASEANVLAAQADERYIAACRAQGFYPGAYYPHNVHFLWFARAFEGRSADAIEAARKVAAYAGSALCGTEVVEAPRLRHLPLLAYARFGRWDDILAAREPVVELPFDRAMWHYARLTAAAAKGDKATAARSAEDLKALAASPEVRAMDNPYFPGTGILAVAQAVADARLAGVNKDVPACLAAFERAVAAEDALPYMEPAFWYYPTRQSLAAALLDAGKAGEAERVFREDLRRNPRNGWSLFGLARALEAQDRHDAAGLVTAEFRTAWRQADTELDLAWY